MIVAVKAGKLILDRPRSETGFTASDEFRRRLGNHLTDAQTGRTLLKYREVLLNDLDSQLANLPKVYTYALSDTEQANEPTDALTKEVAMFNGTWDEFKAKFETWVAAGTDRLELKKIFSGAGMLQDLNEIPRNTALIFNSRVTKPPLPFNFVRGSLSFRVADPIHHLENDKEYLITFPNEQDVNKAASKRREVLKVLKSFEGKMWRGSELKSRLEEFYAARGFVGTVKLSPAGKEPRQITIPEGARIARILFSKDVPLSDIDKVAYLLLPDKDFRAFVDKKPRPLTSITGINGELSYRAVDYLNLKRQAGAEPFINQFQFQIQQLELSQLGYVAFQVEAPNDVRDQSSGSSYIEIFVNKADEEEEGKKPDDVPEPAQLVPNEEGHLAPRPEKPERKTGFIPPASNLTSAADVDVAAEEPPTPSTSPTPVTTPTESPTPSTAKSQWRPKEKKNYVGFGLSLKRGQKLRIFGLFQRDRLGLFSNEDDFSVKAGAEDNPLGALNYSSDYVFFDTLHRRLSLQFSGNSDFFANRVFGGIKTDERRTGGLVRAELEIFRDRGSSALRAYFEGRRATVQLVQNDQIISKQNLSTIDIGGLYLFESRTAYRPKQLRLEPRLRLGLSLGGDEPAYSSFLLTGNYHQQLPHFLEVDITGRLNLVSQNTPLFELPSLGGAEIMRGFREDDALGRRLWSLQNELWMPLPGTINAEKGLGRFLRRQVRLAGFVDLGAVYNPVFSKSGLRTGPGTGLRIIYRPAIIKLDWAYGFGNAAGTNKGHGRFYFSVGTNLPF